jgi:hypothetical protein
VSILADRKREDISQDRILHFFSAVDTLDADAAASFFAPKATWSMDGTCAISGRILIRRALVKCFTHVHGLRHQPVMLWVRNAVSIFEADLTILREEQTALTIPVTHVLRWRNDLIEDSHTHFYCEAQFLSALRALNSEERRCGSDRMEALQNNV